MKNILVALLFICTFSSVANSTYCYSPTTGKSWSHLTECVRGYIEISQQEFCEQQIVNPNMSELAIAKSCPGVYSAVNDKQICEMLVRKDGTIKKVNEKTTEESIKRDLSIEKCKIVTGRFTKEEKKYIENQIKVAQKKARIKQLKSDCEDIGFKDGTEAMGNCVLKLMELQGNNSPTVITTTTSNSSQEIVDIEKQKLQAQREALKLQQDQLKAEQARVAQERRKAIQRNANKSIQQGKCLMNGGSTWDCM